MKIYITARFKGIENKEEVKALCSAVSAAGHEDFCLIRDVEHWQKVFQNPQDLWIRTRQEIKRCDALLIDVSDQPSGGRVAEAGMAYALGLPVYVVAKRGIKYKEFFDGIASEVIHYDEITDITAGLSGVRQLAETFPAR